MSKFFYFFLIILISSCSSTTIDNSRCRVNGNEDYLTTDSLCKICVPDDLTLPLVDEEYVLPKVNDKKSFLNVGRKVNICPPSLIY